MKEVKGGYNMCGFSIGVLMLNMHFPRVPGDVGNATTYDFPMRFKVVQEAEHNGVMAAREQLLAPFVKAARELEAEGVKGITTTCGFLAAFQRQLAAAVRVPVFTSSLLQVPMVSRMLCPDQKVGIMTVEGELLGEKQFNGCGWSSKDIPVVVVGLEKEPLYTKVFREDRVSMDVDQMEADMVAVAKRLVRDQPEVGAIVLECTNMPPYSHAVQAAVGLPVFDIQTLIRMFYDGLHKRHYVGYM